MLIQPEMWNDKEISRSISLFFFHFILAKTMVGMVARHGDGEEMLEVS